jgi:hypothetical protein
MGRQGEATAISAVATTRFETGGENWDAFVKSRTLPHPPVLKSASILLRTESSIKINGGQRR